MLHPVVPAVGYFVVAVAWVAGSDRLTHSLFPAADAITMAQTLKGLFFVTSSAVLIGYFSVRQHRVRERLEHEKRAAQQQALGAYQRLLERVAGLKGYPGQQRQRSVGRALWDFVAALDAGEALLLWRVRDGQRICVYASAAGNEINVAGMAPLPLKNDAAGRALASGRVVVGQGPATAASAAVVGFRPGSVIAVPVAAGSEPIGLLEVVSPERDVFDQQPSIPLLMAAKLLAMVWHNHDVWLREERTRAAIEASEARFKSLVQHSGDVVMQFHADGSVVGVSASFERILGFAVPTPPRGTILERIHAADLPRLREALERTLKLGQAQATCRVLHANGEWRWFEAIGVNLLEDVNVAAVVLTARDVTDRKRSADAALAAQSQIEDLNQKLRERLERITSLRMIDIAITADRDLRVTLDVALTQLSRTLAVDAASVLLAKPAQRLLETAASIGLSHAAGHRGTVRYGEGLAGRVASERTLLRVDGSDRLLRSATRPGLIEPEAIESYIGVPLTANGELLGVLEVFHRSRLERGDDWLAFLETLAAQVAIAIDNATTAHALQRSNRELLDAYDTTIEGWAAALDLRDEETEGHSRRVTEMSVQLARRLGIEGDRLLHIRRGALLHDIGKMGIPDSILLKPGKLDEAEWEAMRQHPTLAHRLLSGISFLREALEIPYCHHEKWDGTGYPRRLAGETIPLSARIFAIVDVYDALCSNRPYRTAWSEEKALSYIAEQAGRHFDPVVVEAFLAHVGDDGDHQTVRSKRSSPI